MANNQIKQEILDNLQKLYLIGYKKGDKVPIENKIFPLTQDLSDLGRITFKKENWPSQVERVWKMWMSNTWTPEQTWQNMMEVYEDMDMLWNNSPVIQRAITLIVDEVVQADLNFQCIGVEAKKNQKNFLLKFFDKIGLYNKIRPIVSDLVLYGNACAIPSLDVNGVEDLILVDVEDLKERIEFTPYKVEQEINNKGSFINKYKGQVEKINFLIQSIENKENYASYYKSYLFGFQVGERILPPWRFLHFRNRINKSPFKPFGVPFYLHAVAPFSQYELSMSLQAAARSARFPTDVYNITMPQVAPTEKLIKASELMNKLFNQGFGVSKKEEDGVGNVVVTVDGLYSWEQKQSDIDLGKVDDIEMLRDDMIIASMLPRYLVDPNDGGFGDSGVSLIQKWKPFARLVYSVQSIVLEQITQLCKIHMIHSGEFKPEEIDFQLTMPYPESQVNSDIISNQGDLFSLANDIIDGLADKFLGGEALPDELKKNIYAQILPYDDERLDKWWDIINKEKSPEEGEENMESSDGRLMEKWLLKEKEIGKQNLREQIQEKIFEEKSRLFREGKIRNKHFFSSKNLCDDTFSPEFLYEYNMNVAEGTYKKKLNESEEKIYINK